MYELVKKRLACLRDQLKERLESATRESRQRIVRCGKADESLEKYVVQLRGKNDTLRDQVAQLREQAEALETAAAEDRQQRVTTAAQYGSMVDQIKAECMRLQAALEEREISLLRLRAEKAEAEEIALQHKICEKEVKLLEGQRDTLLHRNEAKVFGLQSNHIKAMLAVSYR